MLGSGCGGGGGGVEFLAVRVGGWIKGRGFPQNPKKGLVPPCHPTPTNCLSTLINMFLMGRIRPSSSAPAAKFSHSKPQDAIKRRGFVEATHSRCLTSKMDCEQPMEKIILANALQS